MSEIRELKDRLEAMAAAIEALDAGEAAGRVGADEHARQRAEREREAGRLFVRLRRAQRETRERRAEPRPETTGPRRQRLRHPMTMGAVAVVLLIVGVAAGVTVGPWLSAPGAPTPAGVSSPAPGDRPSTRMTEAALQALQQAAPREDAPTATLLEFAHVALDNHRIEEARRVYAQVLARDPKNVEAITHLGAVLFEEGRVDEALAKVDDALRIDPGYIHALWDRTQYLFHGKRDFPAAIRAADAFLAVAPQGPDAESVRKLMAEARQQGPAQGPLAPKSR
jgi:tetratricopeptide (TPR) repeat protein